MYLVFLALLIYCKFVFFSLSLLFPLDLIVADIQNQFMLNMSKKKNHKKINPIQNIVVCNVNNFAPGHNNIIQPTRKFEMKKKYIRT